MSVDNLFGWVEKRVWWRWVPMGKAELSALPLPVLQTMEEHRLLYPLKPVCYRRPLDFKHHCERGAVHENRYIVDGLAICGQCGT